MSSEENVRDADPIIGQSAVEEGLPFPVVGVGASAGGLEAFIEMLQALPPDPGMAFLFVLHLEPNRKTHLQEILRGATSMPVNEGADGMTVENNHVYLLQPNVHMVMAGQKLALIPRPASRSANMPADVLFRSLARIQKSLAIGVILSGGGTDGTLAFQAIKAEGGVTFAQDEKTAKQHGMPRSAVADGNVDYVLPPKEIAEQLLRIARHSYNRTETGQFFAQSGPALNEIFNLLRGYSGVDFTHYKRSTVERRIQRRMALRATETLADYVKVLRSDPTEIHNLYQDFLIRVTQFFRDPDTFVALKDKVFPKLITERGPDDPIRIWVAGCATGEEVYSLAICLLEYLQNRSNKAPIKILATDVNEVALERARQGIYVDNIEIDVSQERLRRFFVRSNGNYQISKTVRDLCIFSRHNMTADPPFSRLDLVTCRNVLIYMDGTLQRRVLPILHYALKPEGILVLGNSESIGVFSNVFEPIDMKLRMFAKKTSNAVTPLEFGSFPTFGPAERRIRLDGGSAVWTAVDVQKEADRIVLGRYAPVGVVVDEAGIVVQFRGRTASYLEPAPGTATLDLLRMLREGLLIDVRSALNQARAENSAVVREGLRLTEDNVMRQIKLEVIPFKVLPSGLRFFLVLFIELESTSAAPAEQKPALTANTGEQQIQQLQQELVAVREYLQSLLEEHESTNEELKTANEEIMSANEELQSTNEELQTAKEEAQSANEELATVNEELQHRNADLARANNDLVNLLNGVNIPIVMVNRDLRIRRFTAPAEKLLNLIASDVGRPIGDIKPNLDVVDLSQLIGTVIDTLSPFEGKVRDRESRVYILRIRPYVTTEQKIDGASVVLLETDFIEKARPSSRQDEFGG